MLSSRTKQTKMTNLYSLPFQSQHADGVELGSWYSTWQHADSLQHAVEVFILSHFLKQTACNCNIALQPKMPSKAAAQLRSSTVPLSRGVAGPMQLL